MHRIFVATPPGLEQAAADEIAALGPYSPTPLRGGLELRGEPADVLLLNLASRLASRLLVRLGDAPLPQLGSLARRIPWADFLAPGAAYRLESSGGGSRPSQLERPIEEALALAGHRRVSEPDAQLFVVRLADGRAEISADSSGAPLHQRGYRLETGPAPLQENLAAGILLLAGYDGTQALIDPMCGSGTFLVEACGIALRRAPGASRSFACEAWPSLEGDRERVRRQLQAAELQAPAAPIFGSDRNAGSVGVTRRNAERAKVLQFLRLERKDALDLEPPAGSGLLVANPPWGKRLGDRAALTRLHRAFGQVLRERFRGWSAAILTGDGALADALALPHPRRLPLRNGGQPCVLTLASV